MVIAAATRWRSRESRRGVALKSLTRQAMKGTVCRRLWLLNVPPMATAAPVPSHDLFVQAVEARLPGDSTIALMSPDLAARRRTPGSGNDFPYVDHEKTNSIVGHVCGRRCSCRLSFCSSSRINQAHDGFISAAAAQSWASTATRSAVKGGSPCCCGAFYMAELCCIT